MQEIASFKIKGMQRDPSPSAFDSQYSYENKNIRIISKADENIFMSATNEQGTLPIKFTNNKNEEINIVGDVIGHCVVDNVLIFFTYVDNSDDNSIIYKATPKNNACFPEVCENWQLTELYRGPLNFDKEHPIECLPYIENETNKKVYWIDGKNQPRYINIVQNNPSYNEYSFDFVAPEYNYDKQINVEISKVYGEGQIYSGTIQFVITFINDLDRESTPIYISPLYYVSDDISGVSPENTVNVGYKIKISGISIQNRKDFKLIRVYAIHRSSLNEEPVITVSNVKPGVSTPMYYTYTGVGVALTSYQEILNFNKYIINPYTIASKDDVLFLGNYEIKSPMLTGDQESIIKNYFKNISFVADNTRCLNLGDSSDSELWLDNYNDRYFFKSQLELNSKNIKYLKRGESYRLAIQLIDIYGNSQNIVYLGDFKNKQHIVYDDVSNSVYLPYAMVKLDSEAINYLKTLGFYKIRPLIAFPDFTERNCIAQGVISPTIFSLEDRISGSCYAQSSWIHRPIIKDSLYNKIKDFNESDEYDTMTNGTFTTPGSVVKYKDLECISGYESASCEVPLDHISSKTTVSKISGINNDSEVSTDAYFIDQNILTFHSPDLEFDESLWTKNFKNAKIKIVGIVPVDTSMAYRYLDISGSVGTIWSVPQYEELKYTDLNPQVDNSTGNIVYKIMEDNGKGGIPDSDFTSGVSYNYKPTSAYKKLISGTTLRVGLLVDNNGITNMEILSKSAPHIPLYMWHHTGNIAVQTTDNNSVSVTNCNKIISNLQFSMNTIYTSDEHEFSDIQFNVKMINASTNKKLFYFNNRILNYTDSVSKMQLGMSKYYHVLNFKIQAGITSDAGVDAVVPHGASNTYFGIPLYYNTYLRDGIARDTSKHMMSEDREFKFSDWKSVNTSADYTIKDVSGNYRRYTIYALNPKYKHYKDGILKLSDNPTLYTKSITENHSPVIPIKYKSTNHALFNFEHHNEQNRMILPQITCNSNNYNESINNTIKLPWSENIDFTILQQTITLESKYEKYLNKGFLYLGEIYTNNSLQKRNTEDITWLPANNDIILNDDNIDVKWVEGDTYYQRYDNLKTYCYDVNDTNGVVDILSFMCETRINLDGRYDPRANHDNTNANPTNFNLVNLAYTQSNNFYTYRYTPLELRELTHNTNQLTWGFKKEPNSYSDAWVDVRLTSVLNLNGVYGKLLKLDTFKDTLLSFQENSICEILYNSKYQLQTTQGINIEIANNNKMDGFRVLSNLGVFSKHLMCKTPNDIYFVDNISKDLYKVSNLQIPVSLNYKISTWCKNNFEYSKIWNIKKWSDNNKAYTLQYDKMFKDLYIISKDTCLGLSEILESAQSFYSYENTPYIFNLGDASYCFHNNKLYKMYSGKYNEFFGEKQNYYIDYIINDKPLITKIFDTVEYLGDMFDYNSESSEYKINHNNTFDLLEVSNEYQYGSTEIHKQENNIHTHNKLRKKYRQWRALLPRDFKSDNGRGRIVNPWIRLKLSKTNPGEERSILHSLNVKYSTIP